MSATTSPFISSKQVISATDADKFILRYVAVSVYTILLLEHVASFPQEVQFIWKAPKNVPRIWFLSYRYCTLAGLTILMHLMTGLSGPLDENLYAFLFPHIYHSNDLSLNYSCKQAVSALVALSVFSMGTADALVVLRVSVLWGRRRFILVTFLLSFFITYATAIVCAVIVATNLEVHPATVSTMHTCSARGKPRAIFGVWVPGMAFDSLVLSFAAWNACALPRTRETALTTALYRDGVILFLILAGLRAINLFLTIFTSVFLVGACISWVFSAITLSRFIFHLHRLENGQTYDPDSFHDIDSEPAGTARNITTPDYDISSI